MDEELEKLRDSIPPGSIWITNKDEVREIRVAKYVGSHFVTYSTFLSMDHLFEKRMDRSFEAVERVEDFVKSTRVNHLSCNTWEMH